jgi:lysophospholipase L1-like esterase
MQRRRVLLSLLLIPALAALFALAGTASADTTPHFKEYVALGDSWSADVNILNVTAKYVPFGCVQSAADYPHQVATALGVATFRDATCGGSTTDNLTKPQTAPLGGTNAPEFDRLTAKTDLVTLGMGGNDIGFESVVAACLNLLPSLTLVPGVTLPTPLGASCQPKFVSGGVDKVSQLIAAAAPKIATAIAGIKARSPHARIELVNYMNPFPTAGCYPYVQLANEDVPWLRSKLDEINAMLARVAASKHVGIVNTTPGIAGHDICQLPNKIFVTALIPLSTDPLLAIPFHPTQLGANHQATAVLAALGVAKSSSKV